MHSQNLNVIGTTTAPLTLSGVIQNTTTGFNKNGPGELILTGGKRRNADLFLAHLDELRRRYRCHRVIHVICDNAAFHTPARCRKVKEYLERWGHRIRIHFLPTYSPDTNPIERVWWHLHEEVTRNHRCRSIEELLDLVHEWLEVAPHFQVEPSLYKIPLAA